MARGRHYAKLSLSNAARLSFSDLCILLFMFLSLCRLCVCVFLCSHWSLVDVPLIFFCPADHVPDWQPRVLLGMVEARSVNVKKTTTTTVIYSPCAYLPGYSTVIVLLYPSLKLLYARVLELLIQSQTPPRASASHTMRLTSMKSQSLAFRCFRSLIATLVSERKCH